MWSPRTPRPPALLRDFNAPDGAAHRFRDRNAARAREDAAKYSASQLAEPFIRTGPQAIAAARRRGALTADYYGHAILRLDEVVSIGILEATVHLLDLQRALAQLPNVPVGGLAHTAALLAEIAPPVDFIETATGRSSADLFPVLT